MTNDAKGSDYTYANGDHERVCLKLGGGQHASWATPAAREAGGTLELGATPEEPEPRFTSHFASCKDAAKWRKER